MRTMVIARFTFREALRKRILLLGAILSALFLALFAVGNQIIYNSILTQMARTGQGLGAVPLAAGVMTLIGLYAVNFLAGLLSIFIAVGTIASEVDSGTLHAIVPKPVHRWEIVLGKWLGFAVMLVVYLILMAGAVMLISLAVWGEGTPNPLSGIALMALCTILLLSLTVLGSTFLPAVATGIVVFMLYGVGLMGGMIEQIGSVMRNDTMVNIGIFTSLLIPSEVLWKMASYVFQPPAFLAQAVFIPFFGSSPPNLAMVVYAVCYTLVALGLAIAVFDRRDL